jgi:hypothetical protein
VTGERLIGGLVGINPGTICQCYAMGRVSGLEDVGGCIGKNQSTGTSRTTGVVIACFWDQDTSGQIFSDGGSGKTTAEMKTASTFLNVGWDFVDETANGTEDIWWINEGQDYPRLWWEAE